MESCQVVGLCLCRHSLLDHLWDLGAQVRRCICTTLNNQMAFNEVSHFNCLVLSRFCGNSVDCKRKTPLDSSVLSNRPGKFIMRCCFTTARHAAYMPPLRRVSHDLLDKEGTHTAFQTLVPFSMLNLCSFTVAYPMTGGNSLKIILYSTNRLLFVTPVVTKLRQSTFFFFFQYNDHLHRWGFRSSLGRILNKTSLGSKN